MIRYSFLWMCLLLGLSPLNLTGQQGRDVAGKADEMGLDREQWDQIRERWIRSQPVIMLTSYEGDHLSGQPIFAGVDTLYFYASTNLPVGTDYAGQIYRIPIIWGYGSTYEIYVCYKRSYICPIGEIKVYAVLIIIYLSNYVS